MTTENPTAVPRDFPWLSPVRATILYVAAALVMTWPLAATIHERIAGDLGDTLFNAFVMTWTSGQVLRGLSGDLSAFANYWNTNIFHPSPLTLAYSEHLTPQMLQVLPVFAATRNVVLCYNLVFLATIVLSGLGMFLLVRELTGRPLAAFLAGLAFAFAPYRIEQYAHIEVISSQWMPFALYGFRRYMVSGRIRPLAGGAAALLTQGLSCGYYLAYFTPFATAYCVYEMVARSRVRDWRAWRDLVLAGAVVLAAVVVFLLPYARVHAIRDIGVRSIAEVRELSADTWAYATSPAGGALWGERIRALPKTQGYGFPGFAVLVFAGIALAAGARVLGPRLREVGWRRVVATALAGLAALQALLVLRLLVFGPADFDIAGLIVHQQNLNRVLTPLAWTVVVLLLVSPRWREAAVAGAKHPAAFFALATVFAAWLSLGPLVKVNGQSVGRGPYAFLYAHVPGFDGLRVASMYFMLVACFLSVLAGFGAARLSGSRAGKVIVALGLLLVLAEGRTVGVETHVPPGTRSVGPYLEPTMLYAMVARLPSDCVLVEFPYGNIALEIQYTYAAGYHRRPLVNGYSGFFPLPYRRLKVVLENPLSEEAKWPTVLAARWPALLASGATYAIVHEGSYADPDEGRRTLEWLRANGAREIATVNTDHAFALPARGTRTDGK